jgi:hypothetical protein
MKIDPKAEFLITAVWPDNHPDDIDLYVQDPEGRTVWYHRRDAGLMHLDRDDRGTFRDKVTVAGQIIENPINQETVTLRGFMPGQYIVNIHQYVATTRDELVPVSVQVVKLNPVVSLIWYETFLIHGRQEETIVRFTLDERGEVTALSDEFKRLVRR